VFAGIQAYFIFGEIPGRAFYIASSLLIISAIIALQKVESRKSQVESRSDF